MLLRMSSASLASSGSDARPTQAYTMPWLSSLSKGTWEGAGAPVRPAGTRPLHGPGHARPHLEDEAELGVEEAGVGVDLDAPEAGTGRSAGGQAPGAAPPRPPPRPPARGLPGAEGAAVGADLVQAGLRGALGRPPPAPVDDELPLEVGQELGVLLLLRHAHHLRRGSVGGSSGSRDPAPRPAGVPARECGGRPPPACRGRDSRTSSAG